MQRRLHGAQRRHVHGVRGRQIQGFHGARSMHSMSCQLRVACRFVLPLFVAPVCGIMPMPRIILGYICTRMCVRAHAWHVKRHRAQADSSCARIHADGDAERRRRERILPLFLSLSLSLSLSLPYAISFTYVLLFNTHICGVSQAAIRQRSALQQVRMLLLQ